jgi:MoxR-like ATPase
MLFRAAQAQAVMNQREFVIPDDIQRMAPLALSHRVILTGATTLRYHESREVIEDLVGRVEVPV